MTFQNIKGDASALRSTVYKLQRLASACDSAAEALVSVAQASEPFAQAGAGDGPASVLTGHSNTLRDLSAKSRQAAEVISRLIVSLETADKKNNDHVGMTHSSLTVAMPTFTTDGQQEADDARASAATAILELLPPAIRSRFQNMQLYGAASPGEFLSDLWNEGVVTTAKGLWDTGALIVGLATHDPNAQAQVGQLIYGLSTDKHLDGTPGFREEYWNGLFNKDLLERDPAAWATIGLVGIIGLRGIGAGTRGLGGAAARIPVSAALKSLNEGIERGAIGIRSAFQISNPTALQRKMESRGLQANYSRLSTSDGAWLLKPFDRGFALEDLVKVFRAKELGGLTHLVRPQRTVDAYYSGDGRWISIKSIDNEVVSYESIATFERTIDGYAAKLNEFGSDPKDYWVKPSAGRPIQVSENSPKHLDLVTRSSLNDPQLDAIKRIMQKYPSVKLNIIEAPE